MCFDIEYNYFGVASDKGTIHIWKLDDIILKTNKNGETKYKVKNIDNIKSEFSFARIKMNKPNNIFCFKNKDRIVIIGPDEKVYLSYIDNKGGHLIVVEKKNFSKMKEK